MQLDAGGRSAHHFATGDDRTDCHYRLADNCHDGTSACDDRGPHHPHHGVVSSRGMDRD